MTVTTGSQNIPSSHTESASTRYSGGKKKKRAASIQNAFFLFVSLVPSTPVAAVYFQPPKGGKKRMRAEIVKEEGWY
jgi:hypothetical protein